MSRILIQDLILIRLVCKTIFRQDDPLRILISIKNTSFVEKWPFWIIDITYNNTVIFVVYEESFFEWVSESVNEWLLFNANSAFFQLYHSQNNLIFNEIMMSALY